jgi:hypothetical protein
MVIPMKTGDIIFTKSKSPISWLIRVFDNNSKWSHCTIMVSDNNEMLEAQYYVNSRIVPFYFEDFEVISLGLSDEQRKRIQELALTLVGKKYDIFQIVSIFIRNVFNRKFKIFNNPNQYICSEIVEKLLQEVNVIPQSTSLLDMTPHELYDYLKALGSEIK